MCLDALVTGDPPLGQCIEGRCSCPPGSPSCPVDGTCDSSVCPSGFECADDATTCEQPPQSVGIQTETVRIPRPHRFVATSRDLSFDFRVRRVEVSNCWLPDRLIASEVERLIEPVVADAATTLRSVIEDMGGTSAVQHHGLPPARLPECASNDDCIDPVTTCLEGPDPESCRSRANLWGFRYFPVCRGGHCEDRVLEPRRIHVLPTHLEVVLSEGDDSADRQGPYLEAYQDFLATAPPSFDRNRRRVFAGQCNSDREPFTDEGVRVADLESEGSRRAFLGLVCPPDQPTECFEICAGPGLRCSEATIHSEVYGTAPAGPRCVLGACVP